MQAACEDCQNTIPFWTRQVHARPVLGYSYPRQVGSMWVSCPLNYVCRQCWCGLQQDIFKSISLHLYWVSDIESMLCQQATMGVR